MIASTLPICMSAMRVLAGRVDERDAIERGEAGAQLDRVRGVVLVDPAEGQPGAAAALEDEPEQDDEHEREGERPEDGRPVAGVAPDVRAGEREEGVHRSDPVSVAQRATGQVEEDVLERGPPDAEVLGLDRVGFGQGQERADGGRHVARIEQDRVLVVLDRGDRGQAAELGVA